MRKLKRGYANLKNPLYLNANIIYSEAIRIIKKKKNSVIKKLKGYDLVTSILTKYEVIQNLRLNRSISYDKARSLFHHILKEYNITLISSIHKLHIMTDDFIDKLSKTNLGFKDSVHVMIAKNFSMPLCTHDKKLAISKIRDKEILYDQLFKPEELF